MKIKTLELTNYRNHKSFETQFDPGTNVIVGPNGSGKTNILEAIHLMATTKAYKAKYDKEVIRHDEVFAKIEAEVDENKLEVLITSDIKYENVSHKKVKVNKVAKSLKSFSPYLYTVLFSPEEIEILRGSPGSRRHYMDMVL
ncbi:MAG: AAA family ATPase, partial [Patescibacteria group bacterium]